MRGALKATHTSGVVVIDNASRNRRLEHDGGVLHSKCIRKTTLSFHTARVHRLQKWCVCVFVHACVRMWGGGVAGSDCNNSQAKGTKSAPKTHQDAAVLDLEITVLICFFLLTYLLRDTNSECPAFS
jgi:hypothetical protein